MLAAAINVTYMDGSDPVAAAALAASVDVAVVVVATTSHEGSDRTNLSLPWWHDQLVEAVAAVQPKTVSTMLLLQLVGTAAPSLNRIKVIVPCFVPPPPRVCRSSSRGAPAPA